MEHEKSLVGDFGNFQLTIAGTTWGICGGWLQVARSREVERAQADSGKGE